MTRKRQVLGRTGEEIAARYLQKLGYTIIQRNFSCRLGELDIVARDGRALVIVEVRTRSSNIFGMAQESVVYRKQAKVRQVAMYYLKSSSYGDVPVRFDVLAIKLGSDNKLEHLEHIKNAF